MCVSEMRQWPWLGHAPIVSMHTLIHTYISDTSLVVISPLYRFSSEPWLLHTLKWALGSELPLKTFYSQSTVHRGHRKFTHRLESNSVPCVWWQRCREKAADLIRGNTGLFFFQMKYFFFTVILIYSLLRVQMKKSVISLGPRLIKNIITFTMWAISS